MNALNNPTMALSGVSKSLEEIERSDREDIAIRAGFAAKGMQLNIEIPNTEHVYEPPAYFQNPLNDF